MVSVVLVSPPAVADADEQVRDDHAGPVVPPAGLEDLAVGCVVAEEPQLGHDDREHTGVDQLPPAVSDPDEGEYPGGQNDQGADQFGPVVPVPAAHEIHVVNAARQGREGAAGSGVRGRVRDRRRRRRGEGRSHGRESRSVADVPERVWATAGLLREPRRAYTATQAPDRLRHAVKRFYPVNAQSQSALSVARRTSASHHRDRLYAIAVKLSRRGCEHRRGPWTPTTMPRSGRRVTTLSGETAEQAAERRYAEEEDLRESLVGLSRLASDRLPLEDLLTQVATYAVQAIPGADGAGLTLLEQDRADTIVATAPFVTEVDDIQYGMDQGPCISAAREGQTVLSGSLGGDPRWPRFGGRVARLGVHSVVSLPLITPDGVVGAMNVYAHGKNVFDDRAAELGQIFAAPAAIAVHNAHVLAQTRRLANQLQSALEASRRHRPGCRDRDESERQYRA